VYNRAAVWLKTPGVLELQLQSTRFTAYCGELNGAIVGNCVGALEGAWNDGALEGFVVVVGWAVVGVDVVGVTDGEWLGALPLGARLGVREGVNDVGVALGTRDGLCVGSALDGAEEGDCEGLAVVGACDVGCAVVGAIVKEQIVPQSITCEHVPV